MSQSRRICQVTMALIAGVVTVIGFAPSGTAAGSSSDSQTTSVRGGGNGWCC